MDREFLEIFIFDRATTPITNILYIFIRPFYIIFLYSKHKKEFFFVIFSLQFVWQILITWRNSDDKSCVLCIHCRRCPLQLINIGRLWYCNRDNYYWKSGTDWNEPRLLIWTPQCLSCTADNKRRADGVVRAPNRSLFGQCRLLPYDLTGF